MNDRDFWKKHGGLQHYDKEKSFKGNLEYIENKYKIYINAVLLLLFILICIFLVQTSNNIILWILVLPSTFYSAYSLATNIADKITEKEKINENHKKRN
jgi:hypothetical protein